METTPSVADAAHPRHDAGQAGPGLPFDSSGRVAPGHGGLVAQLAIRRARLHLGLVGPPEESRKLARNV